MGWIVRSYIFLILFFAIGISNAFAGYAYSRTITVNHGQVSTNNQTQFPILVCANGASPCNASNPEFKSVSNGGHVNYTSGNDIIFTTDSTCTTKLTWEMEKYSATSGEFEFWVTNTSTALSHTTDTTFYMCYGNSGQADSFQSTAASVWDSNYIGVWHLPNGSALNLNDSTINASNGSNNAMGATTGKIDGGASLSGSGQYGTVASLAGGITHNSTISAWVNYTGSGDGVAISIGSGFAYTVDHYGNLLQASYADAYDNITTTLTGTGWHKIDVVRVPDGNPTYDDIRIFLDGVQYTNTLTLAGNWSGGTNVHFGSDNAAANLFKGTLDEVRVSNSGRTANWITTEYNNQNAPSSFYTMGSETSLLTQSNIQGSSTIAGNSTVN